MHILVHAAAGLGHLHAKNVWHRDVKPANILLKWQPLGSAAGEPPSVVAKVGDFGVSKQVPAGGPAETTTPGLKGTLAYMDPLYF